MKDELEQGNSENLLQNVIHRCLTGETVKDYDDIDTYDCLADAAIDVEDRMIRGGEIVGIRAASGDFGGAQDGDFER